jgi:hypothetical protein
MYFNFISEKFDEEKMYLSNNNNKPSMKISVPNIKVGFVSLLATPCYELSKQPAEHFKL